MRLQIIAEALAEAERRRWMPARVSQRLRVVRRLLQANGGRLTALVRGHLQAAIDECLLARDRPPGRCRVVDLLDLALSSYDPAEVERIAARAGLDSRGSARTDDERARQQGTERDGEHMESIWKAETPS